MKCILKGFYFIAFSRNREMHHPRRHSNFPDHSSISNLYLALCIWKRYFDRILLYLKLSNSTWNLSYWDKPFDEYFDVNIQILWLSYSPKIKKLVCAWNEWTLTKQLNVKFGEMIILEFYIIRGNLRLITTISAPVGAILVTFYWLQICWRI